MGVFAITNGRKNEAACFPGSSFQNSGSVAAVTTVASTASAKAPPFLTATTRAEYYTIKADVLRRSVNRLGEGAPLDFTTAVDRLKTAARAATQAAQSGVDFEAILAKAQAALEAANIVQDRIAPTVRNTVFAAPVVEAPAAQRASARGIANWLARFRSSSGRIGVGALLIAGGLGVWQYFSDDASARTTLADATPDEVKK